MSETNTLQCNITGSVLKLLQNFHDRWDRDHSLNYTLEDCLVAGIEAKRRSKEYSVETQNRKKFEKEIATDPSVILHPDRMLSLMKKYGIGASNSKLESQVVTAAEQMQKDREAQELAELEKATAPTAPEPVASGNGAAKAA